MGLNYDAALFSFLFGRKVVVRRTLKITNEAFEVNLTGKLPPKTFQIGVKFTPFAPAFFGSSWGRPRKKGARIGAPFAG